MLYTHTPQNKHRVREEEPNEGHSLKIQKHALPSNHWTAGPREDSNTLVIRTGAHNDGVMRWWGARSGKVIWWEGHSGSVMRWWWGREVPCV